MDLMVPSFGLLLWTVLAMVAIGTAIFALVKLANNHRLHPHLRLLCALGIIAFPIVGSLVYLNWHSRSLTQ